MNLYYTGDNSNHQANQHILELSIQMGRFLRQYNRNVKNNRGVIVFLEHLFLQVLYTNGRTPHTHFPGPCLHGYNSPSSHRTNYKYFNIFTYPLSVGREAIILENRLQYKNIATSITLPVMYVSWKRQILGWKSAEGNWIYVYIFIIYIYVLVHVCMNVRCLHTCTDILVIWFMRDIT